jgi:uncharacterized repeat protein (TIGR03803 family)
VLAYLQAGTKRTAADVLARFIGMWRRLVTGAGPKSSLTNVNGVLYGQTTNGPNNHGTVFRIATSGAERILHNFTGGSDGATANSRLTNINGVLYGTTYAGGTNGDGTVFKIMTSGPESVLYRFRRRERRLRAIRGPHLS